MDFDINSILGASSKSSTSTSSSKNVKNNGKNTKSAASYKNTTSTLSDSIKNFKAKKEQEEKMKQKEASEKKNNLLALRAENKKSSRAANAMLKMTKSANKSAIDDATNHRDTSATLAGRNQCDSDDFGYESNAATSIYEKLMMKYEKDPEDPMAKFARPKRPKPLAVTAKDPGHDPKFQPYRKPDSSKATSSSPSTSDSKKSSSSSLTENSGKIVKKSQNKAPPPPSFAELLKMAEQKKNQPSQPKDLKVPTNKDAVEFPRPMTAAQKEEYIRERNSQLRKSGKLPPSSTSKPPPPPASTSKLQSALTKPETKRNGPTSGGSGPKSSSSSKPSQSSSTVKGPCKENNFRQPCMKPGGPPPKRDFHSVESRAFPGEVQPPKVKSRRERSPSPEPLRRKKSSGGSRPAVNRIESDEDDYDSEMDDFIDDSDAKIDVSAEIQKMFGYNRHKYRDEDFDDRSMENNSFASQMKEEARSAKLGRMEDLEDMRREEEENRLKAMRKKQKQGPKGRSRY